MGRKRKDTWIELPNAADYREPPESSDPLGALEPAEDVLDAFLATPALDLSTKEKVLEMQGRVGAALLRGVIKPAIAKELRGSLDAALQQFKHEEKMALARGALNRNVIEVVRSPREVGGLSSFTRELGASPGMLDAKVPALLPEVVVERGMFDIGDDE